MYVLAGTNGGKNMDVIGVTRAWEPVASSAKAEGVNLGILVAPPQFLEQLSVISVEYAYVHSLLTGSGYLVAIEGHSHYT